MDMIIAFPQNCTLVEWKEEGQTFFTNEVKNGEPCSRPNINGLLVVHIAKNSREAFLVIDYIEKYIIGRKKNHLTTPAVRNHIKAVTKFALAYNKLKIN